MVETIVGAESFTESARRVVDYLNANTPLSDWSVTRVAGGEQVHVHVHREDLLDVGDRVRWQETFCQRMVAGASHVVRNSREDPDYADLRDAQKIGAYAGFPIRDDDGEMFGVLCGVNVDPIDELTPFDQTLVELMSDMLSSQLALARKADRERRSGEIAEALSQTDSLTGLLNRRGWDLIVADAQQRLQAYGDVVSVIVIDLDGLKVVNDTEGHEAGDRLLQRAATALIGAATTADRLCRYGGDEFVVLSNNVVPADLEAHRTTFADALAAVGVASSSGAASATPGPDGMATAFADADSAMYADKRSRREA